MGSEVAFAIAHEARRIVSDQLPDLREMFPLFHQIRFHSHFDAHGWFVVRTRFDPNLQIPTGGLLDPVDLELIRDAISDDWPECRKHLRSLLASAWFDVDTFTYVGPIEHNHADWQDICERMIEWLNAIVLPDVLSRNTRRVLRAIPTVPEYDVNRIIRGLWVLECEREFIQGTAFSLEGVGVVTCAHVLGEASVAFRYSEPNIRLPINIICRHDAIDLAIIQISGAGQNPLPKWSSDSIKYMDHLLIAGHPNYRLGDSPLIAPGLVVGFRRASGISRILTNAPVVAGGSGGPVFDRNGLVIGVAATGAERLAGIHNTEDLGIVPIDALALLSTPS